MHFYPAPDWIGDSTPGNVSFGGAVFTAFLAECHIG